jgi:tetratricopeptide (TPR) repeat protein
MNEHGHARQFAACLRQLYAAARQADPSLSYSKLATEAGRQPKPVVFQVSSLSAWLDGKSVPRDPRTVGFLTAYLEPRAAKAGYQPPKTSWETLRRLAWNQTHTNRGGRPPKTTRSTGEPPAGPCLLPADIADFTGRQDQLRQLLDTLKGPARPAALVVSPIAGRAGIGKTALAVHAAHRLRDAFPDGQLFVNLLGAQAHPADPAEVLARFLRALGVAGAEIPDGLAERQEMYRNHLARRRALIVLDNAANEAQVEPLLPGSPTCAVLITSRNRLTGLAGVHTLDLDVLEPEAAVALLASIAGPGRMTEEPAAAQQLVQTCGLLPLAIRVAGARLAARPHWRVSKLLDRLTDEHRRLDELTHGHLAVRASVALSYQGVSARTQQLLRLLGLLEAPDFAAWVAAPLLQVDATDAEDEIEQLVDAQLLDVVGTDAIGQTRYRMHDLIRVYARERARDEEPEADRTAALLRVFSALITLVDQADLRVAGGVETDPYGATPRWPSPQTFVDRLLADALAWCDTERLGIVATVRQASAAGLDEACWELAISAAGLFGARSQVDDKRQTLEYALAATRDAGNIRGEAHVLSELGGINLDQQQFDLAVSRFESAIDMLTTIGDHRGRGIALVRLANVDRQQGRYDDAIRRYQQALHDLRDAGNPNYEVDALRGIAVVHLWRGELELADKVMDQALAMAHAIGSRRLRLVVSYWLGQLRLAQGRLNEADGAFTDVLSAVTEMGDRVGQAAATYGLGSLRLRQGHLQDALVLVNQSLSLAIDVGDRTTQTVALTALGKLHSILGDIDQAVANLTDAIRISREINAPRLEAAAGHALTNINSQNDT